MDKEQLLAKLDECARMDDTEAALFEADSALVAYINDADIEAAYYRIRKS